ncbi:MAG TPA: glycoside hydrolase family 43 protein [Thermodesulfovibrionales bacterium]|nr:glycoside hydrolase family 43 protein [Thermodesulfovibrionales bacterium]
MYRIVRIASVLLLLVPAAFGTASDKPYSNPVLVETYPINRPKPARYVGTLGIGDPTVILYKEKYYLYPTGDNHSYHVYLSDDLVHWSKGPKVFQSNETGVWAPDVFFNRDNGMFYLYYTVNGRIGVAEADRPDGEFRDLGNLISNGIDAHMFRDDDGSYFLYYARYPEFGIFVQPMASPVLKKGEPVQVISPSEAWEMRNVPVTEAPWLLKHQGVYYLLYSGGSANTEHYATGYATAKNPSGPFTKYPGNPIIRTEGGVLGPGHVSVTQDREGKLWMVYHQQKDRTPGWNRIICIDPLWFDEKGVLHGKASRATPRAAPVTTGKVGETVRK